MWNINKAKQNSNTSKQSITKKLKYLLFGTSAVACKLFMNSSLKVFHQILSSKCLLFEICLLTMKKKKKEKKDSLPEVPSCNQQKVVLNTGQQIAAFLSNAGAAKELHSWVRLTPSSCPYLCNVQLFTFPCSKPASFHLFSPCMSTDRACGNSILCTWPAVQFHYANDSADN